MKKLAAILLLSTVLPAISQERPMRIWECPKTGVKVIYTGSKNLTDLRFEGLPAGNLHMTFVEGNLWLGGEQCDLVLNTYKNNPPSAR
jgi:hypothetical protein